MDEMKKQKIALFRFQLIAPFLGLTMNNRGEKEKILKQITAQEWEIPGSGRSYIGRSTALAWLAQYQDSGGNLQSLHPKDREDQGQFRSVDAEIQSILVSLKKEFPSASVPGILNVARERKLLPPGFNTSKQTIYRLFSAYGLDQTEPQKKDRRRFEAELPNDLWQSDCMHGPLITLDGRQRKSFLFAFIDDHSRLIPHAQFFSKENLACFLDCFKTALKKRGLPRKLYVDNGPAFRSHQLSHTTASLGIALIHCKPYTPEGKGKIERWFGTIRSSFLPILAQPLSIQELNAALDDWVNNTYHQKIHSVIQEPPLERYLRHIQLVRKAPPDLDDYFRIRATRRVYKDRTVYLEGRVYEAPLAVIGKQVTLLYHPKDLSRVEVQDHGATCGFLSPLDVFVNSRVRRNNDHAEVEERCAKQDVPDNSHAKSPQNYQCGRLFGNKENS